MARKNLLVTGGSRGIGHCVAVKAAEEDWDVCVNYVSNSARADETVKLIESAGGKAIAVQADITKEADVIRLFETCTDQLGPLHGMVNSAGVVEPYGRIDELKYDELLPLIDINVTAAIICAREAVKHMSTKHGGEGGSIVLLSSVASRLGAPGFCVPYAASKAAVDALGWGLAQEVSNENIRVNVVSPGVIDTEIQPAGRVEETGPKLPAGRVGQPEEVAEAILYLLSDKASYVSGTNMAVSYAR
jgi:NAD(P)-dependent dehydrogenase (short-subunit alcohol dehydrogenase family)